MNNFISENIAFLIKKNDLAIDDFGNLFDLSRGVTGQYIRKSSLPKIITIQKICAHYNLTIDDFINKDLSTPKVYGIKQGQLLYTNEPIDIESKYTNPRFLDSLEESLAIKTKEVNTLEKMIIDKEEIIAMLKEKLQLDEKSRTA